MKHVLFDTVFGWHLISSLCYASPQHQQRLGPPLHGGNSTYFEVSLSCNKTEQNSQRCRFHYENPINIVIVP